MLPYFNMHEKTILLTGGGSGIGKAIAIELLNVGYDLIIQYNASQQGANEIKNYGKELGRRVFLIQSDFTKEQDLAHIVDATKEAVEVLYAVIHCAGLNEKKPYSEISSADFDKIFGINIKAPIFITQGLLSLLNKSEDPRVIFIGSAYAHIGGNSEGILYAASKAALTGFVRTLARANIIRANIVAPGYIDAPSIYRGRNDADIENKRKTIPQGRLGSTAEVAKIVKFLLSPDASYITGQVLHINGGVYFG